MYGPFLIICGNLLVITSIMYFTQLHTPTNYLILSLAVADLLVGMLILPFSAVLPVRSCWCVEGVLCKVKNTFDVFLCTSSILNLCFISVDRYYVVCQPLAYKTKMTVRTVVIMILLTWTASALLGVGTTLRGLDPGQSHQKYHVFQIQKSAEMGPVFAFYVPTFIILMIYLKIFRVAHRQARSIQNNTKCKAGVSKMERKATKTLAIVVGVFLLSWSPFFLSVSFYRLSGNTIQLTLIEAFKWFGFSNSLLNPFVYAFFYKWFRSAFKMIIFVKIFRQDVSNAKLSSFTIC
ncbi:trace amine-associated receptor 1-like [Salarias fasciatus]|uniref:trace amine-associated receptor 1-like n=1 Tax=Salarias fasciatus TaxID=181472 RepID=UPI0011768FAE|nr:trace amine-associated receptor 1-like [Salarias fasciatus]